MSKFLLIITAALLLLASTAQAQAPLQQIEHERVKAQKEAQQLILSLELPAIKSSPYHRPYVAVWVETTDRKPVATLAFWKEQPDWFKDLRQWWRKIGRNNAPNYDAVTGATRKPGTYTLTWDGVAASKESQYAQTYVLHMEVVREQGNREYLRQTFTLGTDEKQTYKLHGKTELGQINIDIK